MQSLLRFALIFAVGCSADTFVGADAATADAGSDASDAASDAAKDGGGVEAGKFECNVGTCGTMSDVCCGTFTLGAGAGITSCPIATASTKCVSAANCATMFPMTCSSSGVVRLCAEAQDCASDQAAPKCCNVFAGGMMAWVCGPPALTSYGIICK